MAVNLTLTPYFHGHNMTETKKPKLGMWIDHNDDESLPPEFKRVSNKVRPLVNSVGHKMHEEGYDFSECMSFITTIFSQVYESAIRTDKSKQRNYRDSMETAVKMVFDSVDRGHKSLH